MPLAADKLAAYRKEQRRQREAAGLCVRCGQEPPKRGCKTCLSCLGASAEYFSRYYYNNRETVVEAVVQRERANRAEGLCRCGNEPEPGHTRCKECLRRRRRAAKRRKQNWLELGVCVQCGKQPQLPGLRIGSCCQKFGARYVLPPRIPGANHPWRLDNNAMLARTAAEHGGG